MAFLRTWLTAIMNSPAWRTQRSLAISGPGPDALADTAHGLYVVDGDTDQVTRLAGQGTSAVTRVGYSPEAIAVSGGTAYVVNAIDSTVTPVNLAAGKAGKPLALGSFTYPTAITLAGSTAIVVEPYGHSISLIDTRTNHVYAPSRWAPSRWPPRSPADLPAARMPAGRGAISQPSVSAARWSVRRPWKIGRHQQKGAP